MQCERTPLGSKTVLKQSLHPCPKRAAAAIEALELRRLLAAAIVDRTLIVDGTAGDDVIQVFLFEPSEIRTRVNGVTQTFAVEDVDRMHVHGFDGADRIGGLYDHVPVPTTLFGGNGGDEFGLVDPGGPLLINGEAGDDSLNTNGPAASFTFDGGAGIDLMEMFDSRLVDLRIHPNVEDGAIEFGTIIGNGLDNTLEVSSGGSAQGLGGNDTLLAGRSETDLFGGDGNDTLVGGPEGDYGFGDGEDDSLSGGAGLDTLDYSARTSNLGITLDGVANDGASDEGDNAGPDIETVIGGSGNDYIIGNGLNNLFRGNGGNDFLGGLGGNDALYGGGGNDRLEGGNGNDYLQGDSGNDALLGETGIDFFAAGDGDDWLYSRDGITETVNGGNGFDRAQRDASDNVISIEAFLA